MLRPFRVMLMASLTFHFLLATFFLSSRHLQKERPLEIELRERVPPLHPRATGPALGPTSSPAPGGQRKHSQPKLNLNALANTLDGHRQGPGAGAAARAAEAEEGHPETKDWGSGGGKFAEIEHFSQYERLFQEIRGLLNYPGRLAERGISGTVNSRLAFDENSRCDWSQSRVEGAHPYLRFYTLALLRKLCRLENIAHLRFHRGQFVDLSFAFVLTEFVQPSEMQLAQEHIVGNTLSFYRSSVHSSLEYKLGPLRGYWFAPVVSIDFPWLFEHWEQYVQGKDPLADFKNP